MTCVEKNDIFLIKVENRNRVTIQQIFNIRVDPESIIPTDEWAAYLPALEAFGIREHRTVNHLVNFINPQTDDHTQNIEGLWSVFKRFMRENRGNHGRRNNIVKYVSEFIFKRKRYN